jgi:pimeloyl-ACP methyl ester carboxylesterase
LFIARVSRDNLSLLVIINMSKNKVSRPGLISLISEPGRALFEAGISSSIKKFFIKKGVGDGHPVVVLPGFMSSDKSTKALRKYIENAGYQVFDWGLGRNYGKMEYLEILYARIDEIHQQTGQPISLVGWSLGGVYARQIGKERPDIVRQVITLGSPFRGVSEPNNVSWLYRLINRGEKVENINTTLLENLPLPAPVPTTAVFSKVDGIVPWRMCLETVESDIHQNIEVRSSHLGLGSNFTVLNLIVNRLKLDRSNWVKFKPEGFLEGQLLYPTH